MPTKTAAQRRREAKVAYDAFLQACPSRQLLSFIGDKWVCLVLSALAGGPLRPSALSRKVAGVSQKMLTQTLRALAREGLVERAVTPSVPVRVDYSLTALGQDLERTLHVVKRWAELHMPEVLDARRRFDADESKLRARITL